ncbi:hypothetical protein evm_015438, partial [Chilo suppressalis]
LGGAVLGSGAGPSCGAGAGRAVMSPRLLTSLQLQRRTMGHLYAARELGGAVLGSGAGPSCGAGAGRAVMSPRLLTSLQLQRRTMGHLYARRGGARVGRGPFNSIKNACATIKSNEKITRDEIDKLYSKLTNDIELQMSALKKAMVDQKNREEQERLQKLQEEMRAAEEAKRREQERLKQEEEHRRM